MDTPGGESLAVLDGNRSAPTFFNFYGEFHHG